MEEKILAAIVTSFISELVNESKSIFNELSDEGKQVLKTGFKKYLIKQKDKYSHLKTLLRGNTPVYLYDIYYPLKLVKNKDVIKTNVISALFEKSSCITIIGDAGSGKSTLVKHLFLNSLLTKFAIPILIELRYLNDYANDLESYIVDKILENKIAENPRILERLLEKGKFVFFLDGYDELNSEMKTKLLENLKTFINKFSENKFILTTRPYSDVEHLELFHNYHVKKLSLKEGEIEGFVFKQLDKEVELAKKIVDSIKTDKSEYIQSFLTNPLLLSLYILTFQSNAEVPDKKYIFYRRVIQALFSEHDSKTKLGYVREKLSGLKQEEFEDILKTFCFLSYFDGQFNWDLDYIFDKFNKIRKTKDIAFNNNKVVKDLKSAIAIWIEDNGQYSFAHRSLQEYFAALFVKNLNSKDNERMYSKIIERFSTVIAMNETENFLSLLEEMDTLNFNKFYLLTLLKDLRLRIDNKTDKKLYLSFLKFFATGMILEDSRHFPGIKINNDCVYKSIYIHLPYTQRLYRILTKVSYKDNPKCSNSEIKVKRNNKDLTVPYVDFSLDIPLEFNNIVFEEILNLGKEFDSFVDARIKETESYIKKTFDIDKDLVDLI